MQLVGVVLCIIIIIEVTCLRIVGAVALYLRPRGGMKPSATHHAANSKLHNLHICGGHGLPHALYAGLMNS